MHNNVPVTNKFKQSFHNLLIMVVQEKLFLRNWFILHVLFIDILKTHNQQEFQKYIFLNIELWSERGFFKYLFIFIWECFHLFSLEN